jgi:hypothetical protein
MSKSLADLLGLDDHLSFADAIHTLESSSGYPSEDIRLAADINRLVHQKTKELGLDPRDSYERELFHSLQGLASLHDQFLAKSLAIKNPEDPEEVVNKVVAAAKKMDIPQAGWALKSSVAKRLIKSLPPKRLMKKLGYKSIDSMLKREQIAAIFAAAFHTENQTWADAVVKQYRSVMPGDFERIKISIIVLSDKRWAGIRATLAAQGRTVIVSKQLGAVIAVPPTQQVEPGFTLAFTNLLLHAINYLRAASSYIQLHQVRPEFGKRIQDVFVNASPVVAQLNSEPLDWHTLGRYLAKNSHSYWPETFDPHLMPDDVSWTHAEDALYKLEPALNFWKGLDYAGKGRSVSFNLLDNALTLSRGADFGRHYIGHMRRNLWQELLARYMSYEGIRDDVLRQLEGSASLFAPKAYKGAT